MQTGKAVQSSTEEKAEAGKLKDNTCGEPLMTSEAAGCRKLDSFFSGYWGSFGC